MYLFYVLLEKFLQFHFKDIHFCMLVILVAIASSVNPSFSRKNLLIDCFQILLNSLHGYAIASIFSTAGGGLVEGS